MLSAAWSCKNPRLRVADDEARVAVAAFAAALAA